MPPIRGLDGIGNSSRRSSSFRLDFANRPEPTSGESLFEFTGWIERMSRKPQSNRNHQPWDRMIRVIMRFESCQKPLTIPFPLLLDGNNIGWWGRATPAKYNQSPDGKEGTPERSQIIDIPYEKTLRKQYLRRVYTVTHRSQTQTSGAGLILYLASVAKPMIQGPGSSM